MLRSLADVQDLGFAALPQFVRHEQTQYQINDRLSFQRFLGLGLGDRVADARTIWLFRENLAEKNLANALFDDFGKLLQEQGVLGKEGKIVGASFVEVPRQRNRREENQQIQEGKIPDSWKEAGDKLEHKDLDARWTKKGGTSHYGDKDPVKVEKQSKLIERYEVTPANVHDSLAASQLIEKGDGIVWGGSAYQGPSIREDLKRKRVENRIHQKGCRHRLLTQGEKRENRKKSRVRARVEHVFGWFRIKMKGWMVRSIGVKRARAQIGLMNLVCNFARYEWLQRREARIAS